jgi:hypothetical protein
MQEVEYAVGEYQRAGEGCDPAGKLRRLAQFSLEFRSAVHAGDA